MDRHGAGDAHSHRRRHRNGEEPEVEENGRPRRAEERLERTHRAYALEYVRTMLRVLPGVAGSCGELARVDVIVRLRRRSAAGN